MNAEWGDVVRDLDRVEQVTVELKLNTANPEVIGYKRESGRFSGAWHHAAVARGGAAVARMPRRAAA
jgi:hypothetical protein